MDDAAPMQGSRAGATHRVEALVVGAGFGGMYMLHRLRERKIAACAIEAGGGVGGVWYWNRYPGARCDVMSIDYSYAFSDEIQQAWTWSERFAAGSEILDYADFVADKLGIRSQIHFNTRAERIEFDDERRLWVVETSRGDIFEARYCIMATGPLSVPKSIDIEGLQTFKGEVYMSAKWPHEPVDFGGKRVGVVGTGSSGIQIVPVVAERAEALWVFQRTPSFTLPMRNSRLDADYVAQVKRHYPALRAAARTTFGGGVRPVTARPLFSVPASEREELMADAWRRGGLTFLGVFSDLLANEEANSIVAEFVRDKIGEVVNDPKTAELLKPRGYPIFARRPCLDTGYYEAYNRPNVKLVDCLADPIVAFNADGIKTAKNDFALDVVIFATGYDGLTGAMLAIDIKGRNGRRLSEKWRDGARSYLGLVMEGFPNLFMIGGANGPCATANFISLDEQNADWIIQCIEYMKSRNLRLAEARAEFEDKWLAIIAAIAEKSLMPKASTWYVGANIAGKPRVFSMYIGGFNKYREICDDVASDGFRGLAFEDAEGQAAPRVPDDVAAEARDLEKRDDGVVVMTP